MRPPPIPPCPRHRLACWSVRQRTLQHGLAPTDRTTRQSALRERAVARGWPAARLVVSAQAFGPSGASAAERAGLQRRVAAVGLGNVGRVLGREGSRLARRASAWPHLRAICALTGTRRLDAAGLYAPATVTERLRLGRKGPRREAARSGLRARVQGGLRRNARRAA
jgi:hypothetical protein